MTYDCPPDKPVLALILICAGVILMAFIAVGWLFYHTGHQHGIEESGEYWSEILKDEMK